jgi:hypothetical protein
MSLTGFLSYSRVNWKQLPDKSTPLSAANLNAMDAGIKNNNDMISNLRDEVTQLNSNFGLKNLFKATIAKGETLLSYSQRLTKLGLYMVYSQHATDSPLPNQVSFTIINYAGQDYIYLYLFLYNSIYYGNVKSTTTSIKWQKIA